MNAKRVASFLLLRPAFTQRNLTSLLLVGLFFGVYVLSGGKVTTTPPKISQSGNFGGAAIVLPPEDPAERILGIAPSDERARREGANLRTGVRVDAVLDDDIEDGPIDREGLIPGEVRRNRSEEWRLRRGEKKKQDSLAVIEERLGIKRR